MKTKYLKKFSSFLTAIFYMQKKIETETNTGSISKIITALWDENMEI